MNCYQRDPVLEYYYKCIQPNCTQSCIESTCVQPTCVQPTYNQCLPLCNPNPLPPPRPIYSPEYAYIYNISIQSINIESPVIFSSIGLISSNISFSPGNSQIIINSSGTYSIDFFISSATANQFSIFVNNVAVPSSTYGSAANSQNNGFLILKINSGSIITLVNHTSTSPVILSSFGGNQVGINASIKIVQISP